jgi:RNA polymerase sigma factor (sigma-70 family)
MDPLVTERLKWCNAIAARICRMTNNNHWADDAGSAAREGLLKAWERYDPERGVLFKTFADHYIRGAVIDFLRSMHLIWRDGAENFETFQIDEEKIDPFISYSEHFDEDIDNRRRIHLVRAAVRKMPPRRRAIVTCILEGSTQKETAKRLNITQGYVSFQMRTTVRELQLKMIA